MRRWFTPIAAAALVLALGTTATLAADNGHNRNGYMHRGQSGQVFGGWPNAARPGQGRGGRNVHDRRSGLAYAHRDNDWRRHGDRRWHRQRHFRPPFAHRGPAWKRGAHAYASRCYPTRDIVQFRHGRRAIVRGVTCFDAHGTPYLLPGSKYLVWLN